MSNIGNDSNFESQELKIEIFNWKRWNDLAILLAMCDTFNPSGKSLVIFVELFLVEPFRRFLLSTLISHASVSSAIWINE